MHVFLMNKKQLIRKCIALSSVSHADAANLIGCSESTLMQYFYAREFPEKMYQTLIDHFQNTGLYIKGQFYIGDHEDVPKLSAKIRKSLSLNQSEFSKQMGMSITAYRSKEKNRSDWSLSEIGRLLEIAKSNGISAKVVVSNKA